MIWQINACFVPVLTLLDWTSYNGLNNSLQRQNHSYRCRVNLRWRGICMHDTDPVCLTHPYWCWGKWLWGMIWQYHLIVEYGHVLFLSAHESWYLATKFMLSGTKPTKFVQKNAGVSGKLNPHCNLVRYLVDYLQISVLWITFGKGSLPYFWWALRLLMAQSLHMQSQWRRCLGFAHIPDRRMQWRYQSIQQNYKNIKFTITDYMWEYEYDYGDNDDA